MRSYIICSMSIWFVKENRVYFMPLNQPVRGTDKCCIVLNSLSFQIVKFEVVWFTFSWIVSQTNDSVSYKETEVVLVCGLVLVLCVFVCFSIASCVAQRPCRTLTFISKSYLGSYWQTSFTVLNQFEMAVKGKYSHFFHS